MAQSTTGASHFSSHSFASAECGCVFKKGAEKKNLWIQKARKIERKKINRKSQTDRQTHTFLTPFAGTHTLTYTRFKYPTFWDGVVIAEKMKDWGIVFQAILSLSSFYWFFFSQEIIVIIIMIEKEFPFYSKKG